VRKIIHVDMDCYFAAVEMRDFPEYRGKPLAVGGSRERRGVISTCNYEARRFGVRSAMATAYALKLCPDLILVPGRMQVYKDVSSQIRAIFSRYTELIEPLSLDEAYLDVSDCKQYKGSATLIAEAIRRDNVIPPDKVSEFIKTLPLRKIPGVGKVTAEKLSSLGLNTCGDVQTYPKQELISRFGKFGAVLIERAQGIDDRGLSVSRERKSVGVETTLAQDIYTLEQCQQVMPGLIQELSTRLSRSAKDRQIHKQVVKLKFSDFKQTTIEHRSNDVSVMMFYELLAQAMARQEGRGIRLLGVAVGLNDKSLIAEVDPLQTQLALLI